MAAEFAQLLADQRRDFVQGYIQLAQAQCHEWSLACAAAERRKADSSGSSVTRGEQPGVSAATGMASADSSAEAVRADGDVHNEKAKIQDTEGVLVSGQRGVPADIVEPCEKEPEAQPDFEMELHLLPDARVHQDDQRHPQDPPEAADESDPEREQAFDEAPASSGGVEMYDIGSASHDYESSDSELVSEAEAPTSSAVAFEREQNESARISSDAADQVLEMDAPFQTVQPRRSASSARGHAATPFSQEELDCARRSPITASQLQQLRAFINQSKSRLRQDPSSTEANGMQRSISEYERMMQAHQHVFKEDKLRARLQARRR